MTQRSAFPGRCSSSNAGRIYDQVLIMQGFLKEWMFARMNMLTVLREVKRLQLQVAELSGRQS